MATRAGAGSLAAYKMVVPGWLAAWDCRRLHRVNPDRHYLGEGISPAIISEFKDIAPAVF